VRDRHLSVLLRRDAGGNSPIFQCVAQPVGIVGAVGEQRVGRRQVVDQCARTDRVPGLPGGQDETDRPPERIGDGVEFGVEAAFGAPDQAFAPPFFAAMLEAVRWALRCVASIIRVSVALLSVASSSRIRSKIPFSDQRFQRL